jgi:endonuclease/exonuclease/phosphatase family metal-dependent hydrolase
MTACKEKKPEATTPQSTTPEETTPEPDETVVHASISLEALANYEIVVAKSSSEEADALTKQLQQAMQNVFDLPFTLKTENAYNETQYEILIGETGRKESTEFLGKYNMTWRDYGYAIVGDKLVIRGTNEDGTLEALRAFLSYVRGHNKSEVFFTNANLYLVTDTSYPFPNLTINGIAAKQLSILCNEESLGGVAQIIRDAIIEASGIAVPIVTDSEIESIENKLVVGCTNQIIIDPAPEDITYPTGKEFYISELAGGLFVEADSTAGYLSAAAYIAAQIAAAKTENVVLECKKHEGEDAIGVMSFNLMAGAQKGDKRVDRVIEIILKYRPAVIGVQEATDNWMNLLRERLGDIYTIVGVGRNAEGHDEHSAILYLTEEFDCLESGTKWLSDTPDVAGSKFAESHYTRIMTYALLSRKSDGKQFLHVNTHLDYGTTEQEEAVKVAQMEVLFGEIGKLNLGEIPIIITGDFNATVDSPVYEMITTTKGYQDSCHGPAIQSPTYHALMGTTGTPSHIDFIFENGFAYAFYRICNERVNNENVSDHYPVFAILYTCNDGK